MQQEIRSWLLATVKLLVDVPESVTVQVLEGQQAVIFEVSVLPEDVRRIIGRKGRTADALRELLVNFGSKVGGRRYILEIVEPPGRGGAPLQAIA